MDSLSKEIYEYLLRPLVGFISPHKARRENNNRAVDIHEVAVSARAQKTTQSSFKAIEELFHVFRHG